MLDLLIILYQLLVEYPTRIDELVHFTLMYLMDPILIEQVHELSDSFKIYMCFSTHLMHSPKVTSW